MRNRQIVGGLTALALIVISGGCAASPVGSPRTGDAVIAIPEELPPSDTRAPMPLDQYGLSRSAENRLQSDFDALVQDCSAAYGIELHLVRRDSRAVDPASRMWEGRFGTMTLAHAGRYGYHAAPGAPWRQSFSVFVGEDDSPQLDVLTGRGETAATLVTPSGQGLPQGGCLADVESRVGGNPHEMKDPPGYAETRAESFRHPRTRRAMDDWTECMHDAGYDYATVDAPADEAMGNRLSPTERAIASADVACTRSSRWYDTATWVERRLQERRVKQDRKALVGYEARLTDMSAKARQLMGRSS